MGTQKLLKKGYLRTYDPVRVTLPRLGVKGSQVQILSARQCDVARHRNTLIPRFRGIFLFLALVIACCVEGEVSQ